MSLSDYLKDKIKFGWEEDIPDEYKIMNSYGLWYKGYRYKNISGRYHKLDGPARIWSDGEMEFHIYGKHIRGVETIEEAIIKSLLE